jgi:hypothetical protein
MIGARHLLAGDDMCVPPISTGRRPSPPGLASIRSAAEIALKQDAFFSRSSGAKVENAQT